jgi:hypothetical protein
MAGCRNSVNQICKDLNDILHLAIPCLPKIPPVLLALGAPSRKGLNKKLIASKIISRFSEVGIPNGPDAAGNANVMEAFAALVVEEIIDAICFDARVDISFRPQGIMFVGTGGNAGGPVVVQGFNPSFASTNGTVG